MLSVKNAGHFVNKELCFKSFHEFRANIQLTMFKVWLFLKKFFLKIYASASFSNANCNCQEFKTFKKTLIIFLKDLFYSISKNPRLLPWIQLNVGLNSSNRSNFWLLSLNNLPHSWTFLEKSIALLLFKYTLHW